MNNILESGSADSEIFRLDLFNRKCEKLLTSALAAWEEMSISTCTTNNVHHTQPSTQHVMFLHHTTFTKRHTMFITHLTLCITGQQTIGAQRWAAILSSADVVLLNTLQIYDQWFCMHSVLPQMCYKPLAFSFVGAQRTAQWFVLNRTERWPVQYRVLRVMLSTFEYGRQDDGVIRVGW